jgi:hypothetical protein
LDQTAMIRARFTNRLPSFWQSSITDTDACDG